MQRILFYWSVSQRKYIESAMKSSEKLVWIIHILYTVTPPPWNVQWCDLVRHNHNCNAELKENVPTGESRVKRVESTDYTHTPTLLLTTSLFFCHIIVSHENLCFMAECMKKREEQPPPYLILVGNKEKEKTSVLSLIGFDFGGTQLPADRTVVVQVSVAPVDAAEMIKLRVGGFNTRGAKRTIGSASCP